MWAAEDALIDEDEYGCRRSDRNRIAARPRRPFTVETISRTRTGAAREGISPQVARSVARCSPAWSGSINAQSGLSPYRYEVARLTVVADGKIPVHVRARNIRVQVVSRLGWVGSAV